MRPDEPAECHSLLFNRGWRILEGGLNVVGTSRVHESAHQWLFFLEDHLDPALDSIVKAIETRA